MVDDFLLMQQVQDVLSRYPLQPVDGNLMELAGQVDGHLINVKIPASFPNQKPEIIIDGSKASYQYRIGMSVFECINNAIQTLLTNITPYPQNNKVNGFSDESRFIDDIQQLLIHHPELHPVGSDLHLIQGSISSPSGDITITLSIPPNYPYQPVLIMFNRDTGFGRSTPHTNISPSLVHAVDVIISRAAIQEPHPLPVAQEQTPAYHSERKTAYHEGGVPDHTRQESPRLSYVPPVEQERPTPGYSPVRTPASVQEKKPELPPATPLWGLFAAGLFLIGISFISGADTFILTIIVVIVSAVAAYIDAGNIMSPKVTFGPGRIAICVLILWLIYLPYYILNRGAYFEQKYRDLRNE